MSICNKRFKGVENFLRRVAFNLGNSPSQTEVKIISCIPIDVTDLQLKIAELEKKLEATSNSRKDSDPTAPKSCSPEPSAGKRTSIVNTAAISIPLAHKHEECPDSGLSITIECRPQKKSTLYLYDSKQDCNDEPSDMPVKKLDKNKQKHSHSSQRQENPNLMRKSLFAKNKGSSKKKSCNKTELVYYAKADDKTPFNNYGFNKNLSSNKFERHGEEIYNETNYLTNVLWKQYISRPALNDLSNTSEYSSPICRDDPTHASLYESDVCSCCHGPFQNLDHNMKPSIRLDAIFPIDKGNDNIYEYYDSNAYDLIPVKENTINTEKDHITPKSKKKYNNRHDVNLKCWPDKERTKKNQPCTVNYHPAAPMRNNLKTKPYKKYHKRDVVLRAMSAKRPKFRCSDRNSDDTRICYVDYSDVYSRRKKPSKTQKLNSTPKLNDASCLTTIYNNTDCQTVTESNETAVEDRTATTLNQIKTILQSVLTEVKNSTKLGKNQDSKKDAVVQNDTESLGGSQLLQSYTYSPYNMNPYAASCSRQMPSNKCCPMSSPYAPSKCMHYPLFVQPNRHICTSCYKNGNVSKPVAQKTTGTSAATNTEEPFRRSKETEKLIKDIYESMALNIDLPTKDTTKNQGDQKYNMRTQDLKTTPIKEVNGTSLISEIYKNVNPINTSVTEKTDSKVTSYTNSVRSEFDNNRPLPKSKAESVDVDTTTSEPVHRKIQQVQTPDSEDDKEDDEDESSDVNEDDDAPDSSTVTEYEPEEEDTIPDSEQEAKTNQKRGKKGLFRKMIKIFKSRNSKKSKQSTANNKEPTESESDSDDYQTVYSQKITPKAQMKPTQGKMVQLSPGRSQGSPERTVRKPPYLEQEYRRYWDERLIFENRYGNHSTQDSQVASAQGHPYSRNYEARVAITDPNTRIASPPNAKLTYPVKRSSYHTNRTTTNRLKKVDPKVGSIAWLKKHKLNLDCADQWKKLILEG